MSEVINNRAHRVQQLKKIIKRLHSGAEPDSVKEELTEIVKEASGSEIVEMEHELMQEGMKPEEITAMCDLHSEILRDITVNPEEPEAQPGHPIDTFKLENHAIRNNVESLRKLATQLPDIKESEVEEFRDIALGYLNKLMDVDKHYARKENLVFPFLEKHEITGPSQVMWAKDDQVRELLKNLISSLRSENLTRESLTWIMQDLGHKTFSALEEMIYKEEQILFPMVLEVLTEQDWGEVYRSSPEIGWCIVEPRKGYEPPKAAEAPEEAKFARKQAIMFDTGHLNEKQLKGIMKVLPFDLTFIDHEDRVAFFSHGPKSVFVRNETIIGRKVQHCHPPKSVDVVERILADFKSGEHDKAEFWIEFRGDFVHITYFAVRDEKKNYIGTLEVTQNATHVRNLEGEQRLLSY